MGTPQPRALSKTFRGQTQTMLWAVIDFAHCETKIRQTVALTQILFEALGLNANHLTPLSEQERDQILAHFMGAVTGNFPREPYAEVMRHGG